MAHKDLLSKLPDIPLAQPGFDTLSLAVPTIVQLNSGGKWESNKPDDLDEERLKCVVQHILNSNAVSQAQSYCCQCAAENKTAGLPPSNYVPVIMMPIYPSDKCPFDMESEISKIEGADKPKRSKQKTEEAKYGDNAGKESANSKKKKQRGFVLQRLTDFDLLSQW